MSNNDSGAEKPTDQANNLADGSDPFRVGLPDGSTLGRQATLEHVDYGVLEHESRSRTPHGVRVRFRIVQAEHRMFVEFSAVEISKMWGRRLHDDPVALCGEEGSE